MLALPSECIRNPAISYRLRATTLVQAPIFYHLDYCVAPNWPPCRCPRLSVVCFQHSRSNDAFEIQVSSGQKPTRAPYPFRVKSEVLTRGPKNQLLSSLTGTLVQVHPSPGLSVNLVEQSGPRTFALPVPLPPRYLHHLSSFFLQDFVQMSPSWWDLR